MELVKRSTFGWGPTAAGIANPRSGLVIHYDGSDQGLAGKPHSACITYWKNTRRFHMGANRGWADIGYSFGACLPLDSTEVLTQSGWTMLGAVTAADLIASWAPDSGAITFDAPVSYIPGHEDKVIKVHHWEMTRDHRMFIKDYRRPGISWKERAAAEVKRNSIIPAQGEYAAPGLPIEDDVLRLLVWAQADGNYIMRPSGIVTLRFHLVKQRKIERILALLGTLGLSHTVNPCHGGQHTRINIHAANWLRANVYRWMPDKTWTWEFLNLDGHQVDVVMDELPHADGDTRGRYYTAEPINADVISALCVLHGRKAAVIPTDTSLEVQVTHRSAQQHWVWSPSAKLDPTSRTTRVGCVETVNGTLIIRQSGKVALVGNCPHGVLFEGRGENHVQAAQPGGNSTFYSVTLMSGPGEDPTTAQIDTVRQLRAYLMRKGMAGSVRGHRDFFSTSCPGDRLYRMVRDGTFTRSAGQTPAAHPQEDDVPEVVSLGAGEEQKVPASGELAVRWEKEYADDAGDHGAGGTAVLASGARWAVCDALVKLRGLTPGQEVDVAWSRYSRDGKTFKDDAWRLTYTADASGRIEQSVGGQFGLGAGNQLRLRVINPGQAEVTVEKVTMAKIAMFKR
jgi:hypothetical protein